MPDALRELHLSSRKAEGIRHDLPKSMLVIVDDVRILRGAGERCLRELRDRSANVLSLQGGAFYRRDLAARSQQGSVGLLQL